MHVDAIVIGSGVAGLTTAATLAKNGKKVYVFEQHSVSGGYATSFSREGMRFDVSLHLLGDMAEGGMVKKKLEDIGVIPDLKFYRANTLYKAVFPNNEIIADNYANYTQKLCALFPEEKEKIQKLFDVFVELRKDLLVVTEKSENQEIIDISMDAKTLGIYQNYSLKDILDEFIRSEELRCIISQYWTYFGLPPSQLSAVYYAYIWTEYFIYGGYYPHDRSQAISNRLVEIVEENDGQIFLKSKVKRIVIENKKAVGIELENGKYYYAKNIVSNANLKDTFEKLVGHEYLNKRYIKKLKNILPSLSNIQVYLILDIDFFQKYGEPNHEIFVNDQYDIEQAYLDVLNDQVHAAPFKITIYENIIKGYNQEGKSTISLFQLSSFENWRNLSRSDYKKKKSEVLCVMIDRLNKLFPGIAEHITYSDMSTPITNERYTSNTDGATYGAAMTVDQVMHKRLAQQTIVSNLMLAGAWTRPASGYSGCIWSGYSTAKMILRNEEKK